MRPIFLFYQDPFKSQLEKEEQPLKLIFYNLLPSGRLQSLKKSKIQIQNQMLNFLFKKSQAKPQFLHTINTFSNFFSIAAKRRTNARHTNHIEYYIILKQSTQITGQQYFTAPKMHNNNNNTAHRQKYNHNTDKPVKSVHGFIALYLTTS